ncbi:MAG: SGNH/GDSL hydrolase family protein [Aquabacterium sp.]|nr:SGNH/GDSL hydrolase family protein [Aquabacterium sp.]
MRLLPQRLRSTRAGRSVRTARAARTAHLALMTACAVAAAPQAADAALGDQITGAAVMAAWSLMSPELCSVAALDRNVWQGLIDTATPFLTPYAQAMRKLALTKAPRLYPQPEPPMPSTRVLPNDYTQIISFGDSMSDTGNMLKVTGDLSGWKLPMEPNWQGRFSNGPVVLEVMAGQLGKPLVNYAFGGGQSNREGLVPVYALQIGVLTQVDNYLDNLGTQRPADSRALYVIWTGPDDFYEGSNIYKPWVVDQVTANVRTAMLKLYQRGARQFFVPQMPDLSITPSARVHAKGQVGYIEAARKRSAELAASMQKMLAAFAKQYPQAKVRTFATYSYSQQQIAQGARDGYNVTDSCYTPDFMGLPGPVCAEPDKYLFWDENHPTAAGSRVIGTDFATAAAGAPLPSR